MPDIKQVVAADHAKGVALLDEKMPGWRRKITTPVVITSTEKCVLAQILGEDYNKADFSVLGYPGHKDDAISRNQWASELGFYPSDKYMEVDRGNGLPMTWSLGKSREAIDHLNDLWNQH